MLKKHTLVVGPFQCNCSVIVCEANKEAVLIDAGDEFPRIQKWLSSLGVTVKLSVHTHAHLDHIGAVSELKRWSPQTKICLHDADRSLYEALPMQGQMFGFAYETPPPVDRFLKDEEEVSFGGSKLSVIHTPGHSPGGICLKFESGLLAPEPVIFSGDTLFRQSIGRTDLWGGDTGTLLKSIRSRLLEPEREETIVFPGHGPSTTLAIEARSNPFLS